MGQDSSQFVQNEWVSFPGGELEGLWPKTLCAACRQQLQELSSDGAGDNGRIERRRTLCFECCRTGLDRDRALRAAGTLDTGSEARFQHQLPFESVDAGRLAMLKAERAAAHETRGVMLHGTDRFVDKRRRAQIAARHALQTIAAGLTQRRVSNHTADHVADHDAQREQERLMAFAIHAAELQLPDAWLPFVVSR